MNTAFKTLFRAVALTGLLAATLPAQTRLAEADRARLIELADRLTAHADELSREAQRGAGPTRRDVTFRNQVRRLENDAIAFRAALLRNRPIEVDAEIERLRTTLRAVEERVHPRRQPDAALRTAARNTAGVLDQMERVAGDGRTGKTAARFEPGAYADVDDIDKLAGDLVARAARMRELSQRGSRAATAVTHFEEQARQFQRVAARRNASAVDHRPHLQRLQGDLNSALREIRRQGGGDEILTEWEWADGILERMGSVDRRTPSSQTVPNELLGLSHELHVQMMRAEELAKAAGRGGDAFARMGDQAYAFHHEMHDGRLSYADAQDRVQSVTRSFRNADAELRRAGTPAELQQQWRDIAATLEKMRVLIGS